MAPLAPQCGLQTPSLCGCGSRLRAGLRLPCPGTLAVWTCFWLSQAPGIRGWLGVWLNILGCTEQPPQQPMPKTHPAPKIKSAEGEKPVQWPPAAEKETRLPRSCRGSFGCIIAQCGHSPGCITLWLGDLGQVI